MGAPEYTGTDVLVKSVGVQFPDGACVRCRRRFRWVPAQVSTSSLDRGSKLRGDLAVIKLRMEARTRQPEAFNLTSKKFCLCPSGLTKDYKPSL